MHIKKIVVTGTEARDRLIKGANLICDSVKITLGPAGLNGLIEKGLRVSNDGISIAAEIQANDEIEDLGVRVVREASVKANEESGDASTTTLVLVQSILNEAIKFLPKQTSAGMVAGKKSPIQLVREINAEKDEVIEKLKAMATPVESKEKLIDVARVAVEFPELAETIGAMQWELGENGTIIAEESAEPTDKIEKIKGIRIDNGFGTSLTMNNQEKQSLEVEDCKIILANYTLHDLKPLPILSQLLQMGSKKVVIVARAWTEEAVKLCLENHKNGFFIYPINAPYVDQVEIMEDMAATLGGTFFNCEERQLEDMTLSDVGQADKVTAYRYNAVFTGEGKKIPERVIELKKKLEGEQSVFARKALDTRISQLENGFALLSIGATSERERKHKFDKAVDGCNAVKSALQEGTVAGGGLALKEISEGMPDISILKKALTAPYNQIQINAGEKLEIEPWVRDSVKSVRIALDKACSVAGQLATVSVAVAQEWERPHCCNKV